MRLLENTRLHPDSKPVNVLIDGGRIAEITGNSLDCENSIDCSGKLLLPGVIDSHVHFRVPGAEHKEDWTTGSRAAVAGGVTTVLDMPNTNPATTTLELLEEKRVVAARDSRCNYGFFLGATPANTDVLAKAPRIAGVKLYAGSSTGNLLVEQESDVARIFETAYQHNLLIMCHAEHEHTLKENERIAKSRFLNHAKYHSRIRTAEAEAISIEKLLHVQEKIGNKLHFAHVSSKVGLDLINEAKQNGLWVTAEVCPHHLFFTEQETSEKGNFAKMNPSLKSKRDVLGLWRHIRKGTVDTIGSDHAPHTPEEKKLPYYDAPSGVPGVQTLLPLLLDAVHSEKLPLEKLVALCCSNPAKIFGIRERGIISEGNFADLTLVDQEKADVILNETQYSKCGWTCYAGMAVRGVVEKTLVNGELAFDNHSFFEMRGREVY